MTRALPLAILLAATVPALAVDRADEPPCRAHACSDDAAEPPVRGNEGMTWDPPLCLDVNHDGVCETPTRYQVAEFVAGWPELCDGAISPSETSFWSPYASGCFPREGRTHDYVVRACGALGCADWPTSGVVSFVGQPYACFELDDEGRRCQAPCYSGQAVQFDTSDIPSCESER